MNFVAAGGARESPASAPWIRPFIKVRIESFGSLLYNPYLGQQAAMDQRQTRIMRRFDGNRTASQIAQSLVSEGTCGAVDAEESVLGTIRLLSGLFALSTEPRRTAREPAVIHRPSPEHCLSAPRDVIWCVTRACNLHCPHCLTDSGTPAAGELDTRKALRLVESLGAMGVLHVSLSGGEPLLRPDILVLMDALSGCNMGLDLSTNGVGLTRARIRDLAARDLFQVQVSVDGIGEEHDRFRGRKGAFQAAAGAMRRIGDEGIAIGISTTVTRRNVDSLEAIIDFAVERGCSSFKAIPFLPAGRGRRHSGDLQLRTAQYRAMSETLVRKRKELQGRIAVHVGTSMFYILDPQLRAESPANDPVGASVGCSAGHDVLFLGPDGTVYPCPFLQDFPLGNARDSDPHTIWMESPFLHRLRSLRTADLPARCRECGLLASTCNGGCRAAAFLEHGDLLGMDPSCFKHAM